MKLDHVTAVVGDLEQATEALRQVLGAGPAAEATLPGMVIRTFAVGGAELHINAPSGPGPVKDFYDARGPGLHHLAFQLSDLDQGLAELSARGLPALGEPVETAPGLREAFLDPRHTGGLLIQLVERRGADSVGDKLDGGAVARLAGQSSPPR